MHDVVKGFEPREALREALGLVCAMEQLVKESDEMMVLASVRRRLEYVLDYATIYKKLEGNTHE